MKVSMKKIMANKYLLWGVFGLTIVNVLGYLANNQYNSLTFMICVGLLTSFFNKNMTVVLLVAVLSTALVNSRKIIEGMNHGEGEKVEEGEEAGEEAGEETGDEAGEETGEGEINTELTDEQLNTINKLTDEEKKKALDTMPDELKNNPEVQKKLKEMGLLEGFVENMGHGDKKDKDNSSPPVEEKEPEEKVEEKANAATEANVADGENQRNAIKESNKDNRKCYRKNDKGTWQVTDMIGDQCEPGTVDSSTCLGIDECKSLVKSGFSNMKSKNVVSAASTEARVDGKDDLVPRIDSKSTMDQTVNNLNKVLGKKGIKGLTRETKELLEQQKELVQSLGQMAPILKSAKSTLDGLDLPDISGLTGLLKGMNGN